MLTAIAERGDADRGHSLKPDLQRLILLCFNERAGSNQKTFYVDDGFCRMRPRAWIRFIRHQLLARNKMFQRSITG